MYSVDAEEGGKAEPPGRGGDHPDGAEKRDPEDQDQASRRNQPLFQCLRGCIPSGFLSSPPLRPVGGRAAPYSFPGLGGALSLPISRLNQTLAEPPPFGPQGGDHTAWPRNTGRLLDETFPRKIKCFGNHKELHEDAVTTDRD